MYEPEEHRKAMEEIARKEPELLVHFIAQLSEQGRRGDRPAMLIARALSKITALYAAEIKKARGGWSCGTHAGSVVRTRAFVIAANFSEEECTALIEFCRANPDKTPGDALGNMITEILKLRPKPLVHPFVNPYE